jgi:hypothetical protein
MRPFFTPFLVFTLVLMTNLSVKAQDTEQENKQQTFETQPDKSAYAFSGAGITLQRDQYFTTGQNNTLVGGHLNIYLREKVSALYRISIGTNTKNKFMAQFGLNGALGAFFLSSGLRDELSTTLFILSIIIPEGLEFHFGRPNFQISPYIVPYLLQYNTFHNFDTNSLGELGMKFHIISNKGFAFSPTVAVKNRWEDGSKAVSVGLQLSFHYDR